MIDTKTMLVSMLAIAVMGSAAVAAPKPAGQAAGGRLGGALKAGEYACYGSGGTLLAGLGFRLAASGQYVDLDGKNPGSVAVRDGKVYFSGGILGGETGRLLGNFHFVVGQMAECEPWQ